VSKSFNERLDVIERSCLEDLEAQERGIVCVLRPPSKLLDSEIQMNRARLDRIK